MRHLASPAVLVAVMVILVSSIAQSAPQPGPGAKTWEYQFTSQAPMPIRVETSGECKKTYWYILYTVTNKTGQDRIFVPNFTLYTDTGQILRSGADVSPAVFRAIVARHNNPLLKDMADMTGPLLQGEDNAKDGVAIFSDIDPNARRIEIFVSGLSGNTATVKLPVPIPVEVTDVDGNASTVMKDSIVLHRTLQLEYSMPGEAAARMNNLPKLIEQEWVMR